MIKPSLPKSEVAANVAICCIAVVVLAMGTRQVVRWLTPEPVPPAQTQAPSKNAYNIGDTLDLPVEASLLDADATVLLVLQSKCRYCEESLPFYQRLAKKRTSSGRFHMVGLVLDPLPAGKAYLDEAGVAFDAVSRYPLQRLDRVAGTPTLWVVDRSKRIVGAYYGRLDPKQEAELEKLLGVE
jgi:hypothetical protein